jgi:hypothetical protein
MRRAQRALPSWQKVRERRKRLDGYRCVYCGATRDLAVDLTRACTATTASRRSPTASPPADRATHAAALSGGTPIRLYEGDCHSQIGRVLSSIVGRVAGYRSNEYALLKACTRFVEATLDPAPRELRHGRTNREGFAKKKMVAVVALVVIAGVLIYALAA